MVTVADVHRFVRSHPGATTKMIIDDLGKNAYNKLVALRRTGHVTNEPYKMEKGGFSSRWYETLRGTEVKL